MSFTPATRQTIYARAGRCCERCGRYAYGGSIQHRKARGMGGSRDPRKSAVSNGVLLCGTATTPDGCHTWAEDRRHRAQAEADGWVIAQAGPDPASVPIRHVTLGLVWLSDDGMYLHEDPTESEAS